MARKPILLIQIPDRLEVKVIDEIVKEIEKATAEIKEDYYILWYQGLSEGITFKLLSDKDITEVDLKELKEMFEQSLNK